MLQFLRAPLTCCESLTHPPAYATYCIDTYTGECIALNFLIRSLFDASDVIRSQVFMRVNTSYVGR